MLTCLNEQHQGRLDRPIATLFDADRCVSGCRRCFRRIVVVLFLQLSELAYRIQANQHIYDILICVLNELRAIWLQNS